MKTPWLSVVLLCAGCSTGSGIGTPGFASLVGGTVVGTGPRDVWWWAPNAQLGANDYGDALWHYDGSWTEVPVPASMVTDPDDRFVTSHVIAAAEDEVWFVRKTAEGNAIVLRVDASGAIVEDRSADITNLGPPSNIDVQVAGGSNGAFFGMSMDAASVWYRYDGSAWVAIPQSPGSLQALAVVGPDEAYFMVSTNPTGWQGESEMYQYAGGVWTPAGILEGGNGDFVLPTDDGEVWIAHNNPSAFVVTHGRGTSWSQVQITGYVAEAADWRDATRWPLAWGVTDGGELAVLSSWSEPARNGLDWSEQAFVGGQIGTDGAYDSERVVIPNQRCDPSCHNGLGFLDGYGPERLDDGSLVLDQVNEGETDAPGANRSLIVWTP